ncbi:MAG: hypothetical protein ACQKBT_05450 [Puniceicoccales bacterium]
MMPLTLKSLTLCGSGLSAGIFFSASAFGVTLIDEDFSDGNRDGWYSVANAGAANSVVNSAYFSSGKALEFYGSSGNAGAVTTFSPVTLSASGDYLEASASFVYTANPVANSATSGPVLALYDNGGSLITGDDLTGSYSTTVEDWVGYKGTKYALSDTSDVRVYSQDPVGATPSFIYNWSGSSLGSESSSFEIELAEVYTTTLRIELLDNLTDVDISYTVSGNGESYTFLAEDVAVASLTYNQLALAAFGGQYAQTGYVSDITVTSNIPEPGSSVFGVAIVALGVVLIRRRRNLAGSNLEG